jgi:hypothetical protein
MPSSRLVGLMVPLAAACGSPAPAPPATPRPAPVRDHVDEIADVDDRCPSLPPECLEGFDYIDTDGCPDPPPPRFALPPGAAHIPAQGARVLDEVAADSRQLARGARLVIVVEAAPDEPDAELARRAALVARALRDRGVPAGRFRLDPGGPVHLEGEDPPPDLVVVGVEGCAW